MATTRHFTRHINAGETIAEAIKDCIDYGKNPDKTRGGKLISAYECDPATVDAEFLLSKSKYKAITGRCRSGTRTFYVIKYGNPSSPEK